MDCKRYNCLKHVPCCVGFYMHDSIGMLIHIFPDLMDLAHVSFLPRAPRENELIIGRGFRQLKRKKGSLGVQF